MDLGSSLWFFATVIGVAILAVAFIYGAAQWRRRDRRLDPAREEMTRAQYAAADADPLEAAGVQRRPGPPPVRPNSAAARR